MLFRSKKFLLSTLALLLFTLLSLPCFASSIQIHLNDEVLSTPVAPVQENGTTLVPLRVISENLGATVDYKQASNQITLTKDSQSIILTLGKATALVNNVEQSLTLAPQLLKGTTMVPLRFVSANLNCSVNWDSAKQLITIISQPSTTKFPIATLIIKDYGTVKLELYPEIAPQTVANFTQLATNEFYDGY